MSPEQLRDASAADERSDIWSLGIVLYELLAGFPPFRGDNMIELSTRILACRPQRLSRIRPDLPRGLVAVVHRCLNLDPNDRFADVSELAEALSPFCQADGRAVAERVQKRLAMRQTGEIPNDSSPFLLAQRRLSDTDDDIELALGHKPGARRFASRAVAAFALGAMLALVARAFDPSFSRSTAFIGEARDQVVEASARASLAAREVFRNARHPSE
jgi:serine/threonine protein kinase